jgi:hypothetical protein
MPIGVLAYPNREEAMLRQRALHDVVFASKIYKLLKDELTQEIELVKETDKFWV